MPKPSGNLGETLRTFGMTLPGAHEDHPWGELVLKCKGKVFVFLGKPESELAFSVKLPDSGPRLLDRDECEPTGYGLGKSGWVTIRTSPGAFTAGELCALIEESYRAVAPKTLLKQLGGASAATPAAAKPSARPAKAPRRPAKASKASKAPAARRKA
jgi:predicted DNA-binding protein (MmcQ/YjbR family)